MTVAQLFEAGFARLRRGSLDRELARGADPHSSPELASRARELVSRGFRAGVADTLRTVIEQAERGLRPPGGRTAQVPLQRRAILAERQLLEGMAGLLASSEPVSARGVARVEELLTNGSSPLYYPAPDGELRAALRHARATLLLG